MLWISTCKLSHGYISQSGIFWSLDKCTMNLIRNAEFPKVNVILTFFLEIYSFQGWDILLLMFPTSASSQWVWDLILLCLVFPLMAEDTEYFLKWALAICRFSLFEKLDYALSHWVDSLFTVELYKLCIANSSTLWIFLVSFFVFLTIFFRQKII